MKYHQRDIVEVSFLFPDGTFKPHPAIYDSIKQESRAFNCPASFLFIIP